MNKGNPLVEQLRKFRIRKAFNQRQPLKKKREETYKLVKKYFQMSLNSFFAALTLD